MTQVQQSAPELEIKKHRIWAAIQHFFSWQNIKRLFSWRNFQGIAEIAANTFTAIISVVYLFHTLSFINLWLRIVLLGLIASIQVTNQYQITKRFYEKKDQDQKPDQNIPWWSRIAQITISVVVAGSIFYSKLKSTSKLFDGFLLLVAGSSALHYFQFAVIFIAISASISFALKYFLRALHALTQRHKNGSADTTPDASASESSDSTENTNANLPWYRRTWFATALITAPIIKNIVDGCSAYLLITACLPALPALVYVLAALIGVIGLASDLHNNFFLYRSMYCGEDMSNSQKWISIVLTGFDRAGSLVRLFFALWFTPIHLVAKLVVVALNMWRGWQEILNRLHANQKPSSRSPSRVNSKNQFSPTNATNLREATENTHPRSQITFDNVIHANAAAACSTHDPTPS